MPTNPTLAEKSVAAQTSAEKNAAFLKGLQTKANTAGSVVASLRTIDAEGFEKFTLLSADKLGELEGKVERTIQNIIIVKIQKLLSDGVCSPEAAAIIRQLLQLIRSMIQIGLQVLRIIGFARVVVKILSVLVKVITVIQLLYRTLPLPNMFTVAGLTNTFSDIQIKVGEQKSKAQKILKQVDKLLVVVYSFTSKFLALLTPVQTALQILLESLTQCNPALALEVQQTQSELTKVVEDLQKFNSGYEATSDSPVRVRIPGYTLTVIEEEVVDEGRTLKRRRAVAYDDRGILVLQGDLTFSTNIAVLIEELRLKLVQSGTTVREDTLTADDTMLLDNLSGILDTQGDLDALNFDEAVAFADVVEVQGELDTFIKGLKDGAKLKKTVRRKVESRIAQARAEINAERAT